MPALSPIVEGGDTAQALRNTLELARHAEQWNYRHYWQGGPSPPRTAPSPPAASAGTPPGLPPAPPQPHLARAHATVGLPQTSLAHRAPLVLSPKCLQGWRGLRGTGGTAGDWPVDSKCPDSLAIPRKACAVAGLGPPLVHGFKSRTPRQGKGSESRGKPQRFRAFRLCAPGMGIDMEVEVLPEAGQ
jgi:hypothetical protein